MYIHQQKTLYQGQLQMRTCESKITEFNRKFVNKNKSAPTYCPSTALD